MNVPLTVTRLLAPVFIALVILVLPMILIVPAPGTAQAGGILPDGCLGSLTDDQVVVYYFHRKFKCGSCEVVESTLLEALEARYGKYFTDGRLAMCVINIDDPDNRDYLDQYELLSTALVIVLKNNGEVTRFKHLDAVWDVSQDRDAITSLLQAELSQYLPEG